MLISPVLAIAGGDDTNATQAAVDFLANMKQANRSCEMLVYPGADHGSAQPLFNRHGNAACAQVFGSRIDIISTDFGRAALEQAGRLQRKSRRFRDRRCIMHSCTGADNRGLRDEMPAIEARLARLAG